ncbi:hypothetical protein DXG01_003965 [Tephrocybe rancida]|nr:hypothetical protein DXG01_003965 [Tephrocybe rancida]
MLLQSRLLPPVRITIGVLYNPSALPMAPYVPSNQARGRGCRGGNADLLSHRGGRRQATASSTYTDNTPQRFNFVVCIHPEPPYPSVTTTNYGLFKVMRSPADVKMPSFIRQAKELQLAFNFTHEGLPSDTIAPVFHEELNSHFQTASLTCLPNTPHSSPSSRPHANLLLYPWNIWVARQASRSGTGALLHIPEEALAFMTFADLVHKVKRLPQYVDPVETNVARYVLFILLVQEIISGPFPAAVGFGRHICLSRRLWNGFMTPILNKPRDLEPNCNGCVLSPAPLLLPSTSAPAPAFPLTPLTPALLTSPEPAIEEDDDTTPPESPFLNFSPPTQVFPAFTMSPDQIATILNNSVPPSAAMPP